MCILAYARRPFTNSFRTKKAQLFYPIGHILVTSQSQFCLTITIARRD